MINQSSRKNNFKQKAAFVLDRLMAPITYLSVFWLRFLRRFETEDLKISRRIFRHAGIFPIKRHFYEPFFDLKDIRYPLRKDRDLPGIDFNLTGQLAILKQFNYNRELIGFPLSKTDNAGYYYNNGYFESGDAEYLYNMIRLLKPSNIIEIGSGFSTLMAMNAINANCTEASGYACKHICIEPHPADWLSRGDLQLIPQRVEKVDKDLFARLGSNDILFIDSTHVIRPQGDILFEYLEILPLLKPGVMVHIHDIFTPKDYLDKWLIDEMRLWNEQYLLEAFLSFNKEFKVVAALNFLKHNYFDDISKVCPILKNTPSAEPGSFWIKRVNDKSHNI
jgi:hypothetical protein